MDNNMPLNPNETHLSMWITYFYESSKNEIFCEITTNIFVVTGITLVVPDCIIQEENQYITYFLNLIWFELLKL